MQVIIPMAGLGQRFINEGYKDPKPLIKLSSDNRKILEHVLDMFPNENDYIFICNEVHINEFKIDEEIKKIKPNAIVLSMPQHKKGPVYTIIPALPYIKDEEEVVITYCDGTLKLNNEHFLNYVHNNDLDGCILSHSGFHPHTLSSTKMAFMKIENELVTEIKEKESYTDDPMSEHASSGVYYFKKGSYIKKYFPLSLEQTTGTCYNGEYYVTLAYNLLIKNNLKIGYYDTDHVAILGTPHEVRNFEAWAEIVKNKNIKNHEDLLKCYYYWKSYHENNN